jgi:hypothetical protein
MTTVTHKKFEEAAEQAYLGTPISVSRDMAARSLRHALAVLGIEVERTPEEELAALKARHAAFVAVAKRWRDMHRDPGCSWHGATLEADKLILEHFPEVRG